MIFLPHPLECWEYWDGTLCPAYILTSVRLPFLIIKIERETDEDLKDMLLFACLLKIVVAGNVHQGILGFGGFSDGVEIGSYDGHCLLFLLPDLLSGNNVCRFKH